MKRVTPMLFSDSYKQFHVYMYPKNLEYLNSNLTPRKSRLPQITEAVNYGWQFYIKEELINEWNVNFFQKPWEELKKEFTRFHKYFSGVENIDSTHWENLHKLGYLPLRIKTLKEGARVPMRVPLMVIENTHKDFAWLVNFLETAISTCIWDFITVATIADDYKKILTKYATISSDNVDFVQFQGHDFSMRGRNPYSAGVQSGHLLSFVGTDTIPAVYFLEDYYNANMEKELIGCSVPATEHSVMMIRGAEGEFETFEALLDEFPTGIISIVSDTWDFWKVLGEYLPRLKDKILARNGKVVIRPDSGDPADIVCGTHSHIASAMKLYGHESSPQTKGAIEILWDIFGGKVNSKGYKELDPHIGLIYGDSITREICTDICERLITKGFASTNWVAGIGSFTYNYNTRDSLGMAIKATYCRLNIGGTIVSKNIFKDPITDTSGKKSARGLLQVYKDEHRKLKLKEECTVEEYEQGELIPIFENGKLLYETSLAEIRQRLNETLLN